MNREQRQQAKRARRAHRASKDPKVQLHPATSPAGASAPKGYPIPPPGTALFLHGTEDIARQALAPTPEGRAQLESLRRAFRNASSINLYDPTPGTWTDALLRELGVDPERVVSRS